MNKEIKIKITKETGRLLASIRKNAHLRQLDVGNRLGFSGKSGRVYVSRLERGGIENPSLWLILDYLEICEKPWSGFFQGLENIYIAKKHAKVMRQIDIPKYHKKIDRDVAKYTHSINTKFSDKQKIKPLTEFQKEKMAIGFAKHRAIIERIERDVTNLLGNSGEPTIYNQSYKSFTRQYYSFKKKITTKTRNAKRRWSETTSNEESTKELSADSALSAVNEKLNYKIEKWVKRG
ncbi:MAG: helix-turn-helix domain-containing protein, partial [Ignavibacteria bacterium]|nr:helix-turn-helix domain-containing protein [Ignavibacteria bacterium]